MECKQLTERQRRVFDFIKERILSTGQAPSQTEIAQSCNVRQGQVPKILTALDKKVCISYSRYETRGIKLL
jgi:SOS-response transcriptional repressor LexA